MARIKSALELALEKTESVKSDRDSIALFEYKQEGKRIAGAFLESLSEKDLESEIKKLPKDKVQSVRKGVFDVLVSQVNLPAVPEDINRLESIGKGLQIVLNNKAFSNMFSQLIQAFQQYLGELEQYDQAIRKQYAPKLRQKEEELSRRMGRPVQLDPFQDPEFVAFYNQHINSLKDQYQNLVDQVRDQASALLEA